MPSLVLLLPLLARAAGTPAAGSPADTLPDPRPEPCPVFDPEWSGHETPEGLSYEQVRTALDGVIQTALACGRPPGRASLGLTYELMVGCDGVVQSVECTDTDDAPADYVSCVAEVLKKADFDAHEQADGMPVTYPVNVSW
ncbi:MAG: hypothetical protein H6742_14805 [Alphaproteobacteria bacterium]|nr:hypothetical protein [Alphaproteobacteria bacterium]